MFEQGLWQMPDGTRGRCQGCLSKVMTQQRPLSPQWPASGETPADTADPDNSAGDRHGACQQPHNVSSDKHSAEIWIFAADALNLCDADSIPREVLLSMDPPNRLLEGRSGICIEAPHDWRPHPSANLAHASGRAGTLRLCRLRVCRDPGHAESGGPP